MVYVCNTGQVIAQNFIVRSIEGFSPVIMIHVCVCMLYSFLLKCRLSHGCAVADCRGGGVCEVPHRSATEFLVGSFVGQAGLLLFDPSAVFEVASHWRGLGPCFRWKGRQAPAVKSAMREAVK